MSESAVKIRNRRGSMRMRPKRTSKIRCRTGPWGLGPNVAVTLLDVSEAGARLILKTPVRRNQEVEVALEGPGCSRPLVRVAEVAWSVEAADGGYVVGLSFQRRLTYAELLQLT